MVIAGHDDHGLLAAREVPEARQRHVVQVHLQDQVGQQALLFIRLRDGDLIQIDPVGVGSVVEQVVGAHRAAAAIPVGVNPGRVALARIDHRFCQVVGKSGCLAAVGAYLEQSDRRVGCGGGGIGIKRRQGGRAVQACTDPQRRGTGCVWSTIPTPGPEAVFTSR